MHKILLVEHWSSLKPSSKSSTDKGDFDRFVFGILNIFDLAESTKNNPKINWCTKSFWMVSRSVHFDWMNTIKLDSPFLSNFEILRSKRPSLFKIIFNCISRIVFNRFNLLFFCLKCFLVYSKFRALKMGCVLRKTWNAHFHGALENMCSKMWSELKHMCCLYFDFKWQRVRCRTVGCLQILLVIDVSLGVSTFKWMWIYIAW